MRHSRAFPYHALRCCFAPLFRFLFRPKIIGCEHIPLQGNAVIAGNHKHALDPILVDICTRRMVHTLAKKELHDGLFGWLFRAVGSIPVDLHSKQNRAALAAAVEVLQAEGLINVSPEAKRNYTQELLLPFKYGAVSMAQKTDAPIIPYAITGSYRPFFGNLTIVFGEPIYVGDRLLSEANAELYDRIMVLLQQYMPSEELAAKHVTTFTEWSTHDETAS